MERPCFRYHRPVERALRLFVAVVPDPELGRRIGEAAARARLVGFRAVSPEQLHLTLRFLGGTRPSSKDAIAAALARAAKHHAPFAVLVKGGGVFGPARAPQVAWLGVEDGDGRLAALVSDLETELAAAGVEREARPYHPHLTLGRARHRASLDLEALASTPPLGWLRVDELVLFQSETAAKGSVYTALVRVPLTGPSS